MQSYDLDAIIITAIIALDPFLQDILQNANMWGQIIYGKNEAAGPAYKPITNI